MSLQRFILPALMAVVALALSSCSSLEPTPPVTPKPNSYPPLTLVEYGGDQKDELIKQATLTVEAYFRVPKAYDQTIAERIELRSKFLKTPTEDFFYEFRNPEGELPSEERLAALHTSNVEKTAKSVSMEVWALYYGVEKNKNGATDPFAIEWRGSLKVVPGTEGWALSNLETFEMNGNDHHPPVESFNMLSDAARPISSPTS